MKRSFALAAYMGATTLIDRWVRRKVEKRAQIGKEDRGRLNERFGKPISKRPEGPLIWFHAASVGESLSILELLRQISDLYPNLNILVTTGTRSSAALMDKRMPKGTIHQYIPVDTKSAVNGFLNHWQPDLAIWTESEFWPRLMVKTHARKIPMLLINGRISEATAKNWKRAPGMAKGLLERFDLLLIQTKENAALFQKIGAPKERVVTTGSLKEGAVSLPHDPEMRKALISQIGSRAVWFAGSTHEGEEEIVAAAHRIARKKRPELLLILAPRHPERADEIAAGLKQDGFRVARRSHQDPIDSQVEVYLADTLGEMGLWYRVASVSFVGGSLVTVGGHNPFEPAALGSAILHGPHVSNFEDIYQRLFDGEAAICVRSEDELANAVDEYLNPEAAAKLASNAWSVSSDGAGVTEAVLELIDPYLKRAANT